MTHIETAIKMTLDRWYGSVASLDKVLNVLTDEQLLKETAPGKNRGIYLLGHLVAVHDDMLVLLDLGEKQHPELTEPFIKMADKVATELTPVAYCVTTGPGKIPCSGKSLISLQQNNGLKNIRQFQRKILPKNRIATN